MSHSTRLAHRGLLVALALLPMVLPLHAMERAAPESTSSQFAVARTNFQTIGAELHPQDRNELEQLIQPLADRLLAVRSGNPALVLRQELTRRYRLGPEQLDGLTIYLAAGVAMELDRRATASVPPLNDQNLREVSFNLLREATKEMNEQKRAALKGAAIQPERGDKASVATSGGRIGAAGAASGQAASAVMGQLTYQAPGWRGRRVDLCLKWGAQCGQPAADEFCRRSGYSKAMSWSPAHDIGQQTPTFVLGDARSCNTATCDGFADIVCGQ